MSGGGGIRLWRGRKAKKEKEVRRTADNEEVREG